MIKYLPPLDICCDKAKICIYVYNNATLHFKTKCIEHGIKGMESPFAKSLLDYEIHLPNTVISYSKEERRLWNEDKS